MSKLPLVLHAMGTWMYVELVMKPGTDFVEFWPVPGVDAFASLWTGRRITIVFTTRSDAIASLALAKILTGSQNLPTLLVCPIAPGLFGRFRLERFLRFAKYYATTSTVNRIDRVRLMVWPCPSRHDVVADFTSVRSVVLFRTRWWRSWGRSTPEAVALKANECTIVL